MEFIDFFPMQRSVNVAQDHFCALIFINVLRVINICMVILSDTRIDVTVIALVTPDT